MTSLQWQQVKEVFEAALDRPQAERSKFVAEACHDDQEVRREVESLLLVHERDTEFMNTPVGSLLPAAEPILAATHRFGHYEQISLLGQGGMGEVYVALDQRLGRKVALKLLPSSLTHDPAHVHRLQQEARAASTLNHPNIITIHEIGEIDGIHFIASELVEGETLREHMSRKRMTVGEMLEVTAQVASALQAAHELGIVHRDVKPENIMLRRDGVVKVLDFGLAKLTTHHLTKPEIQIGTPSKLQTNAGIKGTTAYMSPEQARGGEVDVRTDVWSLGVILYELIAGHLPFSGETPAEMMAAIRDHEMAPLLATDLPAELARIVTKALSKKPADRYKSAGEMAVDLKSLKEDLTIESRLKQLRASVEDYERPTSTTEQIAIQTNDTSAASRRNLSHFAIRRYQSFVIIAAFILLTGAITYYAINRNKTNPSAPTIRSIAILPFRPVDATHRDDVFESGTADVLIQRLSSMRGFIVRSLNATREYSAATQDPLAAGKEQQVDYVVSSSYELADGRIRITSALINVASGRTEQIYNFEKASSDVFAMQDAVAVELGNKLQSQFATGVSQRVATRGTSNREAYQLYMHGMYLANNRNLEDTRRAIEVLEQAVTLDSNFARAWAGLAYAHRTLSLYTASVSTHETYQNSIAAINKALALDPNLSEAHSALCENKYLYEWDFVQAERECKRAIELDPGSSQAHEIFSRYLMGRGRHVEAIAEIETAIDLEPASRFNQRNYGRALLYARRYPEAVAQLKRVLEMDHNWIGTYSWLASTLALQGNEAEAYEWFKRLLTLRKVDRETGQVFEKAFQKSGWRGVLGEWIKRLDQVGGNVFDAALFSAQIGNKDAAFKYLEEAYQRRLIWMAYLRVEPRLDPLRNDPRFTELLRRVESKGAGIL